ncbi:MAG: hypothetical protein Q9218_007553 [Villophora microphyllina]
MDPHKHYHRPENNHCLPQGSYHGNSLSFGAKRIPSKGPQRHDTAIQDADQELQLVGRGEPIPEYNAITAGSRAVANVAEKDAMKVDWVEGMQRPWRGERAAMLHNDQETDSKYQHWKCGKDPRCGDIGMLTVHDAGP